MADARSELGRYDDERINVGEDQALTYWSTTFGVSRDELRSAVIQVGPKVTDVRDYLLLD
jgi:hypothetical protein